MLTCMNYCPECKRFSINILTNYKGRLICRNCKDKLEREARSKEASNVKR